MLAATGHGQISNEPVWGTGEGRECKMEVEEEEEDQEADSK